MPWAKVRGSRDSLGLVAATDRRGSTGFDPFEKPSAPAFSVHAEVRALCCYFPCYSRDDLRAG